ncbi:alpha/beta fold hydrolase [Moritella sp. PE36]|uniref:alpha/beta fold hydrolase n=1 Tax=Moritella sp. PE36 TaxID=58051 RepID=UPI0002FC56B4|nr:alpha/beta fold hydrolase [Moritella sp. PE36]
MKRLYKSLPSGTVSYLETTGVGPTLLFLHGNSSCAEVFHHQLSHLGKSYRCIALDFLGHGESSAAKNNSSYGFSGCVMQIIEFIDELQLENIIVIGHSLGGHAIVDALPKLNCVAGILLVGAPPFNSKTATDAFLPEPTSGLIFSNELNDEQIIEMAQQFANEDVLPLADWIKVVKSINNTHQDVRPGILTGFTLDELQDEIQILQRTDIAKMSIVGELDGFINNEYFNQPELQDIFAENSLFIADCHHCPHIESPVIFNLHLERFIKQCFPEQIIRSFILDKKVKTGIFIERYMPLPKPGTNQVAIRVKASSVNPFDYKISRGELPHLEPEYPTVLHSDVAGIVLAVGDEVCEFEPGDRVYGCAGGVARRQGALTDVMLADNWSISKMPENLDFQQAAALPLVAIAAWEGLEAAGINGEMKVLIHGGTGGVGHIAIQLAKQLGASVYATVGSEEKEKLARELGVDDTVNYKMEEVEDYVNRLTGGCGFDLVFDTVGNSNIDKSLSACKVGGHVVMTLADGNVDLTIAAGRKLNLHFINVLWPMLSGRDTESYRYILKKIKTLIERDELKPLLDDKQFSFEHAEFAHQFAASGAAIGKVILVNE